MDLQSFFSDCAVPQQKLYEALKAFYVDQLPIETILIKFGLSKSYFNQVHRQAKADIKAGKIPFFAVSKTGPKRTRTATSIKELIIEFRKKNYSIVDIQSHLNGLNHKLSLHAIDRVLKDAGFAPLPKRTHQERKIGAAVAYEPPQSRLLEFEDLQSDSFTSVKGGAALIFLPLIEELGIIKAIKKAGYPGTNSIPSVSYVLSLLGLKLSKIERYSHDTLWNIDRGLGLFAGLNVLPKSTSLSTYSYRVSREMNRKLLLELGKIFSDPDVEKGDFNLDFKAIPHWGDKSVLRKHWNGSRGKAMKSILALFVQSPDSGLISYTDAEIHKDEDSDCVLEFVDFWTECRGVAPKMLIFDGRFTTYENLSKLNQATPRIMFITLRRRGKALVKSIEKIPEDQWKWVNIEGTKRKYPKVRVHDSLIKLRGYQGPIRQIIITENGRDEPAFLITNDLESDISVILRKYARRWLVEQDIAEHIDFFHLNSPSSSIVIKVDFDLTLSLLAHNLYRVLAKRLPEFEACEAPTIFRDFLDTCARIEIHENTITAFLKKKTHLPILFGTDFIQQKTNISWLKAKIKYAIDTAC